MTLSRTLAIPALLALPILGCGGASSPTAPKVARATVKFSVPAQIVATASTDARYTLEATVPLVARETAGQSAAFFNGFAVRAIDEASGTSSYLQIVRLNTTGTIPAGGSVEIPFRAFLPGKGSYRAKVILQATDAGGPAGSGDNGLPAGSWLSGTATDSTTFESDEFRILPPQ